MPDIAGSETHKPTSLRGIAKKADLCFCTKRAILKSPVRENRTPGSVRGLSGNRQFYLDWTYRTGGSSQMHIMGKRMHCSRDNFNYQMGFDNPPGYGLLFGSFVPDMASSRIDLPVNSWIHLVGTFDGQTFRMYMNRALIGTSSFGKALGPTNVAALTIGRSATCSYFTGKIDNVRIYKRALTQTDINQLYSDYK